MLSFKLTPEITKSLIHVSELAAQKRLELKNLTSDEREAIHRYARISNIGASTRIENAILTNSEIDWMDAQLYSDGRPTAFSSHKKMIEHKLSKEKERSIEEVAGLRNVLGIIYTQAEELFPLTETILRGLHQELLQFFPDATHYLGRYKVVPNSVVELAGEKMIRELLKTTDPGPITEAVMNDLISWYNQTLPHHPWSLAVLSEFVFRFLAIHPFQDGNGRLGRSLFLVGMLHCPNQNLSEIMPYLAVDRQIEIHKEEYYLVLRKCSSGRFHPDPKEYKIGYFLQFMLKMFEKSITQDIPFYLEKYRAFIGLSETAKNVLQAFKEYPEKRLRVKELLAQMKIPRRTLVYTLHQLTQNHFLQRYGKAAATRYQMTF